MFCNPYIQFLRYCLEGAVPLPDGVKSIDWTKMMAWAEAQAIVGVIYGGIEKAGKSLNIPFDDLMKWIGYAQLIETRNRLLNDRCVKIVDRFTADGYRCCILKGQGNALMYPKPLLRTSGDIDLWSFHPNPSPKGEGGNVRNIIKYVKRKNPKAKVTYHHIDYGAYKGVEVEIHYRPTYLYDAFTNRRLQKWMTQHGSCKMVELPDGEGHIPVPTWEFNIVYQLSHIYRHIMKEGVGMRQVIDYYYLLKSEECRVKCEESDTAMHDTLKCLGLMEIAGAVMWVLRVALGLEEQYLIVPADERRGRFLYNEIMHGGNFGQHDSRVNRAVSPLARNVQRLKRDFRLVRYFPSECLWEPVFRWYHFFWRMAH